MGIPQSAQVQACRKNIPNTMIQHNSQSLLTPLIIFSLIMNSHKFDFQKYIISNIGFLCDLKRIFFKYYNETPFFIVHC